MSLKNSFALCLIFLVFYGCAKKVSVNLSKDGKFVLEQVTLVNPTICDYSKKGIFYYEDRFNKVKFKGYLKKDCDNNFYLAVLGGFNQQVMEIKGSPLGIEVISSQLENTEDYVRLFTKENIGNILRIMNYPYIRPDESFEFKPVGDTYMFFKDGVEISVDRKFRIRNIKAGFSEILYGYEDELVKIELKDISMKMSVTFF